jgi:Zn-dependent peptidase ImmA (M78 family)
MNDKLVINPKILQWAREECGYSKPEIAVRVRVPLEQYSIWEDTGEDIGLDHLVALSKICKRQIAFFFLPSVPSRTRKPTDFRNLEPQKAKLTDKTLLAFRRAVRYQDFLLQLHGQEYYRDMYSWVSHYHKVFKDSGNALDERSSWIRELLRYPLHEQLSDKIRPEGSYNRWRDSFEKYLGIHVFQFSMPTNEVQGFSYADSLPYCIAINNAYSVTSRTFTLFHELAHILNNQSGLCKPDDIVSRQTNTLEYDCNSFAGSALVPSSEVTPAQDKDSIYELATKFKISSEVYLRRLFTLGHVSENEFFNLLDQIRRSVIITTPHYTGSQIRRSINSRGTSLFDSTVDAMNGGKISYSQASDILGLKVNYLLNL